MIKSDRWIRRMANEQNLIAPFTDPAVRDGVISWGLSSMGYDLKLHPEVQIYRMIQKQVSTPVKPKLALSGSAGQKQMFEYLQQVQLSQRPELVPLDPKNIQTKQLQTETIQPGGLIIPGLSVVLGRSVEYIKMPEDCLALGYGKSTLVRCGIHISIPPLEPEWEGNLTIEISNTNDIPVILYAEGICQLVFYEAAERCDISYAEKNGKYHKSKGIVTSKVD